MPLRQSEHFETFRKLHDDRSEQGLAQTYSTFFQSHVVRKATCEANQTDARQIHLLHTNTISAWRVLIQILEPNFYLKKHPYSNMNTSFPFVSENMYCPYQSLALASHFYGVHCSITPYQDTCLDLQKKKKKKVQLFCSVYIVLPVISQWQLKCHALLRMLEMWHYSLERELASQHY